MTKPVELVDYVFDDRPHRLAGALRPWLEASPRFAAFVETYRDKIRKKVRVTREPESLLDLRGELEVAYALLSDRRLEVAYEPYAAAHRRGPDYAVTYRANLVFNVEVSRLRVEANGEGEMDLPRKEERLVRLVLGKLGQMQAGMPNLLVVHTPAELAGALDLERLMQALKLRVEKNDPAVYAHSPYADPAAFYKDFLHLSAILLWANGRPRWVNRQARPALPEKVLALVAGLPDGAGQP